MIYYLLSTIIYYDRYVDLSNLRIEFALHRPHSAARLHDWCTTVQDSGRYSTAHTATAVYTYTGIHIDVTSLEQLVTI